MKKIKLFLFALAAIVSISIHALAADTIIFGRSSASDSVALSNAVAVYISPSGDTSGVTDLTNIQNAINSLPARGGSVYLLNTGEWYISGSTGIQIGNGTNSTSSGRMGIKLEGIGIGGTVNGLGGGIMLHSIVAGPAIQVNGPITSWKIKNVEINITAAPAGAIALKVVSAEYGEAKNLSIDLYAANQIGIYETSTTATSSGGNSMFNDWSDINIWMGSLAENAIAWQMTGATHNFNTSHESARNIEITTTASTQTGLELDATDSDIFTNFIIWNSGVAEKAIVFNYGNGVTASWPSDCYFYGLDPETSTITDTGTPSGADPNEVYGFAKTNGAVIPTGLANFNVY